MDDPGEQRRIEGMLRLCATIVLADETVIEWMATLNDVPVEVAAAAMANISETVVPEEFMEERTSSSLFGFLSEEWDLFKGAVRAGGMHYAGDRFAA